MIFCKRITQYILAQFFLMLCPNISTDQEKLAPADWHSWHVFATLLLRFRIRYFQLWKTGRLRGGAHLAIQLQSTRMEICMHCKSWMEICMQIKMLCKCKLGLLEVLPAKTMIYESYEVASGCKDSIKLISYNQVKSSLQIAKYSEIRPPGDHYQYQCYLWTKTSSWNWTYQTYKWLYDCTLQG